MQLSSRLLRALIREIGQALPSESFCRSCVAALAENLVKEIKEKVYGMEVFLIVVEKGL